MEPARLASSKQAAAAARPTGSPAGPEWPYTRLPIGIPQPPRTDLGTLDNHLWGPESPSPSREGPPRTRTGWARSGPTAGQKRPKITKKRGLTALETSTGRARWMEPTQATDGLPFSHVSISFCPQMVSVGPIRARLGPACAPQSESKNWLYLGLDRSNRDSDGTFSPCPPPLVVVSTSQNGPNAPLDTVWLRFGVFWSAHAYRKGVPNGSFFFLNVTLDATTKSGLGHIHRWSSQNRAQTVGSGPNQGRKWIQHP